MVRHFRQTIIHNDMKHEDYSSHDEKVHVKNRNMIMKNDGLTAGHIKL